MKLVSAILATLILFLTVQPVLVGPVSIAEQSKPDAGTCCANRHQAPKHESDNNCCNNGHCNNPFLSCSNCFFIDRTYSCCLITVVLIQNGKIELTEQKPSPAFIKDVWHPPETLFQI